MDQVILEKAQSIERCVAQARAYYQGHETELESDFLRQDAIVLNLQRGCQQAISLANRVAKRHRLSIPKESADVFRVLVAAGLITAELGRQLTRMVGFRNIAVHEYQQLDLAKVRALIEHRLDDLIAFAEAMVRGDPS